MELVEGDTLQSLLRNGPLPWDDALRIAKQIVEALEVAHEKGIIHRDLKPGNVMLSNDGSVKVLDFGLAKSDYSRGPEQGLSNSPTILTVASGTVPGVIVGTAAYMSPEQARGKSVDCRADIWAFGAVFYEMLTGRRAFPGEDLTDTLACVVKLEPDWSAIRSDVPARISQILALCLRKDARQRLQNMGDVRLLLEGAFETPVPEAPGQSKWMRFSWVALVSGIALGGLLGAASAWTWMTPRAPSPARSARVTVNTPPNRPIVVAGFPSRSFAIYPDGSKLVYMGAKNDSRANRRG
jgi:serine/threonine protein kinase